MSNFLSRQFADLRARAAEAVLEGKAIAAANQLSVVEDTSVTPAIWRIINDRMGKRLGSQETENEAYRQIASIYGSHGT